MADDDADDDSDLEAEITSLQAALEPLTHSRLADPHFESVFDTDQVPNPSGQTGDPHRLTISLPNSDHTMFSLGEAAEERINDPGIRGRTDAHIHFEVQPWQACAEVQTLISLGEGPEDVGITSGVDAGAVPHNLEGFVMLTNSHAWLESAEQFYTVSREKDLIARTKGEGKNVLVQAEKGHVQVGAGEKVTIGGKKSVTIFSDTSTEFDLPKYDEPVGEKLPTKGETEYKSKVAKAFSALHKAQAIGFGIAGGIKAFKKRKKGEYGWILEPLFEAPKLVLEAVELVNVFKTPKEEGVVKIHAEKEVAITSGDEISMYGDFGVSITAKVAASLTGLVSAGVKSIGYATLWSGVATGVTSLKDVHVGAVLGEVKISGRKEVAISSKAEVLISAEEMVQLGAKVGAVYGKTSAYVASKGFGLRATPTGVHLAKFEEPEEYENPKVVKEKCVFVGTDSVKAVCENTKLSLQNDKARLKSDEIEIVGSGTAKLDGNKVLIG